MSIVLDDFGTGFSSLSSLRERTVDAIMVDRSFGAGSGADDGDRAIVTAIVGMARWAARSPARASRTSARCRRCARSAAITSRATSPRDPLPRAS